MLDAGWLVVRRKVKLDVFESQNYSALMMETTKCCTGAQGRSPGASAVNESSKSNSDLN